MSLDPVKLCEFCGNSVNHEGHRETCPEHPNHPEYDETHCAGCGRPHVSHERTPRDRYCPECRYAHLETD